MGYQRKILVCQDSLMFGGHERMFLSLAPGLLKLDWLDSLVICAPGANRTFLQALDDARLPRSRVRHLRSTKVRGEPYRAPLRWIYRREMDAVLSEEKPVLVLLLQGRIENALVPMLAARRAGIPIVSYLPMAHATSEMGYRHATPVITRILDRVRTYYYRLPDGYAVPSAAVERQLRSHGVTARIDVVSNVVRTPSDSLSRADARVKLGVAADENLAVFVGRIDRHQKGLDLLVDAMARSLPADPRWRFAFVGDGPDASWLREALDTAGLLARCRLINWTDTPGDWYAASDAVVMPSRFEGVPLTMIEALLHDRPVLASEIDVFLDYLPRDGLVRFDKSLDLPAALDRVRKASLEGRFAQAVAQVRAECDIEASRRRFAEAVDHALRSRRQAGA